MRNWRWFISLLVAYASREARSSRRGEERREEVVCKLRNSRRRPFCVRSFLEVCCCGVLLSLCGVAGAVSGEQRPGVLPPTLTPPCSLVRSIIVFFSVFSIFYVSVFSWGHRARRERERFALPFVALSSARKGSSNQSRRWTIFAETSSYAAKISRLFLSLVRSITQSMVRSVVSGVFFVAIDDVGQGGAHLCWNTQVSTVRPGGREVAGVGVVSCTCVDFGPLRTPSTRMRT